jgi:anaerobic selenocysteine-containing dehydrogenase
MHVDDAARRGIADGDQVAVRSLSRLTGVPIKVERSQ